MLFSARTRAQGQAQKRNRIKVDNCLLLLLWASLVGVVPHQHETRGVEQAPVVGVLLPKGVLLTVDPRVRLAMLRVPRLARILTQLPSTQPQVVYGRQGTSWIHPRVSGQCFFWLYRGPYRAWWSSSC